MQSCVQGEPVKRNAYMQFLIDELLAVLEESDRKVTFMRWFDRLNKRTNAHVKQATKCVDFEDYFLPVLSEEQLAALKNQFQEIKEAIAGIEEVNYDGDLEIHWYEQGQPAGTEPWKNSYPAHWTIGQVRDASYPETIDLYLAKNREIKGQIGPDLDQTLEDAVAQYMEEHDMGWVEIVHEAIDTHYPKKQAREDPLPLDAYKYLSET